MNSICLSSMFCEKTDIANRPKSLCKFVELHCANYAKKIFKIVYALPRKSDEITKNRQNSKYDFLKKSK